MSFREAIQVFKQADMDQKAAFKAFLEALKPEGQALAACMGKSAEIGKTHLGDKQRVRSILEAPEVQLRVPGGDYNRSLSLSLSFRDEGSPKCENPFWCLRAWSYANNLHTFVNCNVREIWDWFEHRDQRFGIQPVGKQPDRHEMEVLAHHRMLAFENWQSIETNQGDKLHLASEVWRGEQKLLTKMIKSKIPHIKIEGDAELRLVAHDWKLESFVWSNLWDEKPELEYHFRLNSPDRDSWDWKFPHTATLQEMATKMVEAWRDKLAHHILHHFAKPELVEA